MELRLYVKNAQTYRCLHFQASGALAVIDDGIFRNSNEFPRLMIEMMDRYGIHMGDLPNGTTPFLLNWLAGRPIDMTDEEFADAMNDRGPDEDQHG